MNPQILPELLRVKMPFGKYKDRTIASLPEDYLIWFREKGFPPGKLGMLLATMCEIRINGLEYLLEPLKKST